MTENQVRLLTLKRCVKAICEKCREIALMSFATLLVLFVALLPASADEPPAIQRIVFGSCVHQDREQPIWNAIVDAKPDVFLLIGDNIYGDSSDMNVLRKKYEKLGAQPGYQKLLSTCPLYAIWDDHDYGLNDAGVEFAQKVASQRVFNDFFNVSADSPRRTREGIYDAHIVGPPGRRVQFILLDTRYFRTGLKRAADGERIGNGPYAPDESPEATVLGSAQWKWLEQQLKQPADVRVVASSIQVVPHQHGWEMWANFKRDRQRMFQLIRDTSAEGVVFISGDRHLAEISRLQPNESGPNYPLYELTSSSLNVPSGGGNENELNRHRVGQHYLKVNFGSITIDWQQADTGIKMAIHDVGGAAVRSHSMLLSELQAGTSN